MLSVLVPVYNEADNLATLCSRLWHSLKKLKTDFEIIFTNDGSTDASLEYLRAFQKQYPEHVRIIDFHGNFGQHMALMAGFEHARGDIVVTMDADLQNPPEEIHKLLEKVAEGHDYVGSYRLHRQDSLFRKVFSKLINFLRDKITDIRMQDQGCMLRAYKRNIVDHIVASQERSTFIPALAWQFAGNPAEVGVMHAARESGVSKYNFYKLIRLNFDLITGFSLVPLQAFTIFGLIISLLSGLLVAYLLLRRLLIGPEAQGVFTLFAVLFFLVSVLIMGVGIVGEYIGRIFQAVSKRPRYVINEIIGTPCLNQTSCQLVQSESSGSSAAAMKEVARTESDTAVKKEQPAKKTAKKPAKKPSKAQKTE